MGGEGRGGPDIIGLKVPGDGRDHGTLFAVPRLMVNIVTQ
jgi:hypothetical protein